jgi:hypothetical protein
MRWLLVWVRHEDVERRKVHCSCVDVSNQALKCLPAHPDVDAKDALAAQIRDAIMLVIGIGNGREREPPSLTSSPRTITRSLCE